MDRRIIFALVAITTIVMVSYTLSLPVVAGSNPITMHIVLSERGPLSVNGHTDVFAFIRNTDPRSQEDLLDGATGRVRNRLTNAYVVSRIDVDIMANGRLAYHWYFTPPPDSSVPDFSGRWPMTVTCPGTPPSPPCNIVSDPAVLPGEELVIFYVGYAPDPSDPPGNYVFVFTAHGTVNGQPLDVTAQSSPLVYRP
jgi:hypothetical protein